MKKYFIFLVFWSFQILSAYPDTQDCADCCFSHRWVDITNVQEHHSNFNILLWVHTNFFNPEVNTSYNNCDLCDPYIGSSQIMLTNAINKWNSTYSYAKISNEGATSNSPVVNPYDGINIIGFQTSGEEQFFTEASVRLAKCSVHLPETAYNCNDDLVHIRPYVTNDGADISFNPYIKKFDEITSNEAFESDYPYYDLESVILHELGHFLGLCHPSSSDQSEVMHGTTYNAMIRRTLSGNDIQAIERLYGGNVQCDDFSSSGQVENIAENEGGNSSGGSGSGGSGSGGSGGSACRKAMPTIFDTETNSEFIKFIHKSGLVNKNVNILIRRIVQNHEKLMEILEGSKTEHSNTREKYHHLCSKLYPLFKGVYKEKKNLKVKEVHIRALLDFICELQNIIDLEQFAKEDLLVSDIENLKKSLPLLVDMYLNDAIIYFDHILDVSSIPNFDCNSSIGKTDPMVRGIVNIFYHDNVMNMSLINCKDSNYRLEVFDINGSVIFAENIDVFNSPFYQSISIATLLSGIYVAALYNKDGNILEKVVKFSKY